MKINIVYGTTFLAQTKDENLFAFRRFVEISTLEAVRFAYTVDKNLKVVQKSNEYEWFSNGDAPLVPWDFSCRPEKVFYADNS